MISVQRAAPSLSCHNQAVSRSRYRSHAVFWLRANALSSSSGSLELEFVAAIFLDFSTDVEVAVLNNVGKSFDSGLGLGGRWSVRTKYEAKVRLVELSTTVPTRQGS